MANVYTLPSGVNPNVAAGCVKVLFCCSVSAVRLLGQWYIKLLSVRLVSTVKPSCALTVFALSLFFRFVWQV